MLMIDQSAQQADNANKEAGRQHGRLIPANTESEQTCNERHKKPRCGRPQRLMLPSMFGMLFVHGDQESVIIRGYGCGHFRRIIPFRLPRNVGGSAIVSPTPSLVHDPTFLYI